MWKHAMASPAPKASNAVALAREGPRSTKKLVSTRPKIDVSPCCDIYTSLLLTT